MTKNNLLSTTMTFVFLIFIIKFIKVGYNIDDPNGGKNEIL